ncbi:META domain-containing protein [Dysgonomonas sp. Marseille-P4677]|uniref:META domain-containing protein n=1 Tax=Dysgonomonas sp. Marseille-P4677 TaxID=2364790 RepID=UPI001914D629|nr:META domain-containing protein [Dysgonomonas sp. Marseille-P4677]MBK5721725.1 META domain-containing protein [Dysgonomonas sp. Marseille-P4677]
MRRIFASGILLVAVVTLIFGLQSCNSVKPINKSDLAGYWTLKTLKGEDSKSAFAGTIPNLQFNFDNNTLSGNSGCNNFSGGFTLTEQNSFTAPNLISTMMACIDANKEPEFLTAISTPDLIVSIDKENTLTFTKDKVVLLQFVKGEAPKKTAGVTVVNAETLAGVWNLTLIDGGDVAKLFTNGTPTIEFSTDGKVFGNGGCNTYRSSYTQEENTITFGPLMSTKMACPSLEGENLFTSLLSGPLQAGLNGDKLTFLKDGKIVLEFAKASEK